MSVKILIVDNQIMIREGLRMLLASEAEFEVIGAADSGQEAIELASKLKPNVVVMSVAKPDMDGIEASKTITSENPGVKVVTLSMFDNKQFIVAMFKAGASAYVLKQMPFSELVRAIESVVRDKTYLCGSLTDMLLDDYQDRFVNYGRVARRDLNERETAILKLLATGMSSKEIGLELGKSPKTVDAYRRQIMRKTRTKNLAEMIKYAIRSGLTSLDE